MIWVNFITTSLFFFTGNDGLFQGNHLPFYGRTIQVKRITIMWNQPWLAGNSPIDGGFCWNIFHKSMVDVPPVGSGRVTIDCLGAAHDFFETPIV